MVQQIFSAANAFFGQHLRELRADAAHKLDFTIEAGHTQDANAFRRGLSHVRGTLLLSRVPLKTAIIDIRNAENKVSPAFAWIERE